MDIKLPKIEYSKTSEIPSALARLGADKLTELVEGRLRGEDAGLPSTQRDEEPEDVILYAFRGGSGELRQRLREAVSVLLMKYVTREVAASKSQESDAVAEGVLRRLFWLAGLMTAREALPAIVGFWRLPEKELLSPALQLNILKCVGSLANVSDVLLVPWLREELSNPLNCRVALQALFKIDRVEAANALPRTAEALAKAEVNKAAEMLSRTLTLMVPSLSADQQLEFLRMVEIALARTPSPRVFSVVTESLQLTPGLAPEAEASLANLEVSSLLALTHIGYIGQTWGTSPERIARAVKRLEYPTVNAFVYEPGSEERPPTQGADAKAYANVISKSAAVLYLGARLFERRASFRKKMSYTAEPDAILRWHRKRYTTAHLHFGTYRVRDVSGSANPFVEKQAEATPIFVDSIDHYPPDQMSI